MKKSILFIALFLAVCAHAVEMDEELAALNHLVEMTQNSLESQKKLRILLLEYAKAHQAYLQNMDNKDTLFVLVKTADKLYQTIKDNHLTQTFSQDFLNDLAVFSKVAKKRGIPNP